MLAIIAIALVSVGINVLFTHNSKKTSDDLAVDTPAVEEVINETIVLTHGHESKRNYVYTGETVGGVPNGQGTAQYPETKSSSSSTFVGTFVNGIPSNGELAFSSGVRYNGEFDEEG